VDGVDHAVGINVLVEEIVSAVTVHLRNTGGGGEAPSRT
jgi:hypothetical protein